MELSVKIDDAGLRRKLALVSSRDTALRMNRAVGNAVLEQTKGFLAQMSVTRHRVADRLGATYTKNFEDAPDRTVLVDVSDKGATIAIKNTPGLSRAYHDLHIKPKRVGALTIPVHRISYGKRVADLRGSGHVLFRPKGKNILAEASGKGKNAKLRPLYALVKSATVPRDEGLLPTVKDIREWATDAAEVFLENDLGGG